MRWVAALVLGCAPGEGVLDTDAPPSADSASTSAPTDSSDATSSPTEGSASRCVEADGRIVCAHATVTLRIGLEDREVHYQVPVGAPPAGGWPVAIVYQGSLYTAAYSWDAAPTDPIGLVHQAGLTRALLDGGYAVITPEAHLDGALYWDTNIPPWSVAWETSADHALVVAILDGIADGSFGPLDPGRLFATGISSGGYMTSRMALSYPGVFRALAVHSASWATCAGAACLVPNMLPADHPPTLFVHGRQDLIVPIATALPYRDGLAAQGTPVEALVVEDGDHAWFPASPSAIVAWFDRW